jgi:hypothetical protein
VPGEKRDIYLSLIDKDNMDGDAGLIAEAAEVAEKDNA